MIEIPEHNSNYPCLQDKPCGTDTSNPRMFQSARVVYGYDEQTDITGANLELAMASGGYYRCIEGCGSESVIRKGQMQQLLNNVPASFEGFVLKFPAGRYKYICSRNNNFTNRSQKGMLNVVAAASK